jgi:hypothetical protein
MSSTGSEGDRSSVTASASTRSSSGVLVVRDASASALRGVLHGWVRVRTVSMHHFDAPASSGPYTLTFNTIISTPQPFMNNKSTEINRCFFDCKNGESRACSLGNMEANACNIKL